MFLTIIHPPVRLSISIELREEPERSPPPIDAHGEEVPESDRGEVIELRRAG